MLIVAGFYFFIDELDLLADDGPHPAAPLDTVEVNGLKSLVLKLVLIGLDNAFVDALAQPNKICWSYADLLCGFHGTHFEQS